MKRFLVPAFFVIDAEKSSAADDIASQMQDAANRVHPKGTGERFLMLDEELPTVEVPIDPESTELPHTYKDAATREMEDEVQSENPDKCPYCGFDGVNDRDECWNCGL